VVNTHSGIRLSLRLNSFMPRFLLLVYCLLISVFASLAQGSSEPRLTLPPTNDINCTVFRRIKAIHITGNRITRREVILRELSISEDQPVCSDSLEHILHLNYQRLYNLNLFTDIELKGEPWSEDSTYLIVGISLKEQWFLLPQADIQLADRNINVWWYEQDHDLRRVNLGLYLQHKNVSGNMDRLTVSAHVGYTQQLALTYTRPYMDRAQKQGIGFGIGASRSRELAYASDSNKLLFARDDHDFITSQFFANASYIYRAAYHSRHILQAGYYRYNTADTIRQLNTDYFSNNALSLQFLELSYRYELNHVDNWNYPRRGIKIVAAATGRYGLEGMDWQALASLELGLYHKAADRWYGSFVFRGRTSLPQPQSYFLQAALGYKTNYVRGYEYYVVDAYHYGIGRFTLKYELLRRQFHHLPFRYLPELPLWIYPKLFFDAGYAANDNPVRNNFLANRFLYSYGIGLDIITAYDLKLRIEFAINHMGQSGMYLHANSE
jgi:outer membrane protein assembly factor BamA